MKNWKTTLTGLVGAIALTLVDYFQNGGKLDPHQIVLPITIAVLGFVAKDLNVTGGTVSNIPNDPAVVRATEVKATQ
jgi:hypothetical protein